MAVLRNGRAVMGTEEKKPETLEQDPWETNQVTERLPAWEQWEDGIEPADDGLEDREDRAA
jgi:hypothetical protein